MDSLKIARFSRASVVETTLKTVPSNQIKLSKEELEQPITRVLQTHNPSITTGLVNYHFKKGQFVHRYVEKSIAYHVLRDVPSIQPKITELDRSITSVSSKDGLRVVAKEMSDDFSSGLFSPEYSFVRFSDRNDRFNSFDAGMMVTETRRSSEQQSHPATFYKCERGVQTLVRETCDDAVNCGEIKRLTFSGQVDQGIIYDAYNEDEKKRLAENDSKTEEAMEVILQMQNNTQSKYVENLEYNLRVLERMVCQNQLGAILMDYLLWNDPADEFRQQGSFYPLWRIKHAEIRARKLPVNAIEWSSCYTDLLYIGYGSLKNQKAGGAILLFSLKNPTYPEYAVVTECPVLALNVHPKEPNIVCSGFADGSVAVYKLQPANSHYNLLKLDNQRGFSLNEEELPVEPAAWSVTQTQYHSMMIFSKLSARHFDPCWQVAWHPDPNESTLQFLSLGADGRIIAWLIESEKLVSKEILQLKAPLQKASSCSNEADSKVPMPGVNAMQLDVPNDTIGGCCMAFQNPPRIVLLYSHHKPPEELRYPSPGNTPGKVAFGTTTGAILVFPTISSIQAEWIWSQAHQLPVSNLQWNPIVAEVLISCSADWTVKFWSPGKEMPLLVFDLFDPVMDVAWAPYSSSIFATLTYEGRVQLYDLCVSKAEPLASHELGCAKLAVKGNRLSYNPTLPLLFVGDSRGDVITLKLSPNLIERRVPWKPLHRGNKLRRQLDKDDKAVLLEEERKKLRRLLNLDALYTDGDGTNR